MRLNNAVPATIFFACTQTGLLLPTVSDPCLHGVWMPVKSCLRHRLAYGALAAEAMPARVSTL